ncbi:cobalt-precorrin-6A reductase [Pelagibacterium lacus]|uniref:Cobalt-precorrin-6A reductase n=1 Tax=Pelagibacterium lacus TaxID=2282655 RepID=A0A369W7G4_9HYPH|nr:cobalt-precorrin-6A reductase [Pelagibacterium lacus]RDE09977.1 cobalt-precorrin-6A reductase [Pelagibacterium lacus]
MGNGNADRGGILILGGTGEARALAAALVARGHEVTTSLAGRTSAPSLPAGAVRSGGFGGAEGLAAYLAAQRPHLVIDATHPFAARISANAAAACRRTGTPLVRLERPAWSAPPDHPWIEVATIEAAAAILPSGATGFLSIGRQELAPFFSRPDCRFVARMIEVPSGLPADWTAIAARGPFSRDDERALFSARGITHLVSKNSGGDQTHAKLDAAADLGIAVIMVARPPLPPVRSFSSVAALLADLI